MEEAIGIAVLAAIACMFFAAMLFVRKWYSHPAWKGAALILAWISPAFIMVPWMAMNQTSEIDTALGLVVRYGFGGVVASVAASLMKLTFRAALMTVIFSEIVFGGVLGAAMFLITVS